MASRVKRKKSRKLWLKIPLVVIIVLILGVGTYAFSVYNNAKKTVNNKMHEQVDSIDLKKTKEKVKATDPLNILLLGIDSETSEKGRSDALMVLSLDPKNDAMQLVSIPRDTRAEIVGHGTTDKINHAYAFGGADMSIATVENFLDIELDYFVRMNMSGLESLVDQLGEITVYNDIEWSDGKYDFGFGPTTMNGDKTMHFVRMRKQDPAGDFGRTKRQRQVIQGIVERGASVGSITKIDGIIDILGNNMATNLDFDDMKQLLFEYKDTRKNFVDYQMKGSGTTIGGIYYLVVEDDEVAKVSGMIKEIGL